MTQALSVARNGGFVPNDSLYLACLWIHTSGAESAAEGRNVVGLHLTLPRASVSASDSVDIHRCRGRFCG